jgi:hypothetical protein
MSFSLLVDAVRAGLAADKPTVPNCPVGMCQLYYETDTGILNIGNGGAAAWRTIGGSSAGAQPTPTAKTADFTATIAELLTRIITVTKASAVAATLPLGTDTDAGFFGGLAKVGDSFEFTVINLGSSSGAVTMTAAPATPMSALRWLRLRPRRGSARSRRPPTPSSPIGCRDGRARRARAGLSVIPLWSERPGRDFPFVGRRAGGMGGSPVEGEGREGRRSTQDGPFRAPQGV